MSAFLRFAHLLALGVWVGSIVLLSFVVAPSLFQSLPRDMAGRAVASIFPRYYALGAACGVVALLAALLTGSRRAARGPALLGSIVLAAVMTGVVLFSWRVVLPRVARARQDLAESREGDPGLDAARRRFDGLHRQSVTLNGTVLILGIASMALASATPPRR